MKKPEINENIQKIAPHTKVSNELNFARKRSKS